MFLVPEFPGPCIVRHLPESAGSRPVALVVAPVHWGWRLTIPTQTKDGTRKDRKASWRLSKNLLRGNAAEQILSDLKEQILVGRMPRGTRLPSEKELALHYGVSSPTVRNAMRGLVSAGLIAVKHGSGASVTADSDQLIATSLSSVIRRDRVTLSQTIQVLVALNGLAAELAASHASEEDLRVMQAALDDISTAGDMPAVLEGFGNFLDRLATASGNPLLASLCRSMAAVQLEPMRELDITSYDFWSKSGKMVTVERQRLLDAIRAGEPEDARAAAKAYYDRALHVITPLQERASEGVANGVAARSGVAAAGFAKAPVPAVTTRRKRARV